MGRCPPHCTARCAAWRTRTSSARFATPPSARPKSCSAQPLSLSVAEHRPGSRSAADYMHGSLAVLRTRPSSAKHQLDGDRPDKSPDADLQRCSGNRLVYLVPPHRRLSKSVALRPDLEALSNWHRLVRQASSTQNHPRERDVPFTVDIHNHRIPDAARTSLHRRARSTAATSSPKCTPGALIDATDTSIPASPMNASARAWDQAAGCTRRPPGRRAPSPPDTNDGALTPRPVRRVRDLAAARDRCSPR
ncbi:hypothetical protein M2284_003559 [Rhodococcus sp. LBL1]|nr:hypothetical protein [Rhodococcus sp. LBL1]MDH6685522.1 hypothetical protein [Rhodococcus sp. LBL2]